MEYVLLTVVLQPGLSADGEEPELDDDDNRVEISCAIVGPDYVTVGVPSSVECLSNCKACTFSMSVDSQRAQGSVLAFTEMDKSKTLVCKATNSVSGLFVAATQNITVTYGPSEIQIIGPDVISISEKQQFVCSAECLPSCRYVSSVNSHTVRGNVMEESSVLLAFILSAAHTVTALHYGSSLL
ncbi:hypothetical protein F7725_021497 [Dissostichus mawsoni]|uniref:Uncharacterized protein n=1 Tax=Dissostichus mawsoni TaxID=36200 RepID=A0A7J5ZFF4_DISMA|nr:hypothetical protein F7725_021497 [Dissostichus mawsoni]